MLPLHCKKIGELYEMIPEQGEEGLSKGAEREREREREFETVVGEGILHGSTAP